MGSYVAALTIVDRLLGDRFAPSHDVQTGEVSVTIPTAEGALLLEAVRETNAHYRSSDGT